MSDGTYHLVELFVLGLPLWGSFLYLIFIMRLYPPHRHTFDRDGRQVIEFPPGYSPGKSMKINGG